MYRVYCVMTAEAALADLAAHSQKFGLPQEILVSERAEPEIVKALTAAELAPVKLAGHVMKFDIWVL